MLVISPISRKRPSDPYNMIQMSAGPGVAPWDAGDVVGLVFFSKELFKFCILYITGETF